jgi:NADH-ubiquinone oxidoreductase chain 4
MFNRIAFAGSTSKRFWSQYIPDLNKREFFMLTVLVLFTVLLGIYPSIILDGINYYTYHLLYNIDLNI